MPISALGIRRTIVFGALLTPLAMQAQRPPLAELREASRSAHAFGRIAAIRVLADGSTLVLDGAERKLLLLDAKGVEVRQIGRNGDGPGEYRSPRVLFPLGGDTTVILDGTNRKWYVLAGSRFIDTPPPLREAQARGFDVIGVDAPGRVLQLVGFGQWSRADPLRFPTRPVHADSLLLLRHRIDRKVDTLQRLRAQYFGMVRQKRRVVNGEHMSFGAILNPLQTYDQAVVFPDGVVAVAHFEPYRVDWLSAGGIWTRGAPVEEPTRVVTAAVREAVAAAYRRDANDRALFSASDFPPWPRTVPPFVRDALHAGLDGRLYVRRTPISDADPEVFDVFDRTARRVASLRLPSGARFLTASALGVHAAVKNADYEEQIVLLRVVGAR